MLKFSSVMIGSMQPKVLADFYEKVFEKKPDMQDGSWYGWAVGEGFVSVGEHSEMGGPAKDPGRVMFNFESKEVKEEFDRISKIDGVKVIKEPYEMGGAWICTLGDPDGNLFQIMTPWES